MKKITGPSEKPLSVAPVSSILHALWMLDSRPLWRKYSTRAKSEILHPWLSESIVTQESVKPNAGAGDRNSPDVNKLRNCSLTQPRWDFPPSFATDMCGFRTEKVRAMGVSMGSPCLARGFSKFPIQFLAKRLFAQFRLGKITSHHFWPHVEKSLVPLWIKPSFSNSCMRGQIISTRTGLECLQHNGSTTQGTSVQQTRRIYFESGNPSNLTNDVVKQVLRRGCRKNDLLSILLRETFAA